MTEMEADLRRDAGDSANGSPRPELSAAKQALMEARLRGAASDGPILRARLAQQENVQREYIAPRTPTEATVAAIWAEVLAVERVGAMDDFFVLGGHSLTAMRVLARVRDALGVEVPLRALFETPTVAGMVESAKSLMQVSRSVSETEIAGWGPTAELMERVDELSEEELDRLLGALSDGREEQYA